MPLRDDGYWYWFKSEARSENIVDDHHITAELDRLLAQSSQSYDLSQLQRIKIVIPSYTYFTNLITSTIHKIEKETPFRDTISADLKKIITSDFTYYYDAQLYLAGSTGKWMVFVDQSVAKAMIQSLDTVPDHPYGLIGAKTPSKDENRSVPLILYTDNCLDPIDTEKSLLSILEFVEGQSQENFSDKTNWYYKPDAFTLKGIYSGHDLKPYIYQFSSRSK